jgi:multiple sugar transport system substrate-binding protein
MATRTTVGTGWTRRQVVGHSAPATAAALAACTIGRREEAAPGPLRLRSGVTVTFQSDGNAPGKALVEQVIAAWTRQQPGIAIDLIWAGQDKLQASLAADQGPDVFALADSSFAGLASRGTLLDIGSLLRRDRVDTADIYETVLSKWRYQEKQYGLPRAYNTAVLYTNVSLFKQAGVPLPPADWKAPGWDFASFLDACRRLTRRDGSETLQWGANLLNNMFQMCLIYANGGSLFSADLKRCTVNEKPALEALQFLYDLAHTHRVIQTPAVQQAAGGPRQLFLAGKCAMELFGSSNLNLYRQVDGFELDWLILPRGAARRASWGGGQGWAIGSYSRVREEAWAFFRHITSSESVTAMADQYFPYRKSSAQAFLAREPQLPPRNRRPVLDGMEVAEGWPAHRRREELQRAVEDNLRPIWTGEKPPREAADATVRAADPLLR